MSLTASITAITVAALFTPTATAGSVPEEASAPATTPTVILPDKCNFGRVKAYDPEIPEELATLLLTGASVYAQPYNYEAWITLASNAAELYNSFDYLRIESPSHVLRGVGSRYKANMFDAFAYGLFHTSEVGYVGKDKSNYEANSYFNMTFNNTHGYGLAWVSRGELCSAKGVWVQEAPTILPTKLATPNSPSITLDYHVDEYSQAVMSAGYSSVTVYAKKTQAVGNFRVPREDVLLATQQVSGLSGSITVAGLPLERLSGPYTLYAKLNDGTFSTEPVRVGSNQ